MQSHHLYSFPGQYLKLGGTTKETSTLSETSDVGSISSKPVSSTTSILSDAQAIILAAWRNTTETKYKIQNTFKRWANFCGKRSINSLQRKRVNIIKFLTEEFKRVSPCNLLVSPRSALGRQRLK